MPLSLFTYISRYFIKVNPILWYQSEKAFFVRLKKSRLYVSIHQKKRSEILLFLVIILIIFIAVLVLSGPQFFIELFYPSNITYVDVESIDSLFVERSAKMSQIGSAILEGQLISPCLLHEFLELDLSLQDKMQSCIIDNGFVITEKQS